MFSEVVRLGFLKQVSL